VTYRSALSGLAGAEHSPVDDFWVIPSQPLTARQHPEPGRWEVTARSGAVFNAHRRSGTEVGQLNRGKP
jgi:hypothetical protein